MLIALFAFSMKMKYANGNTRHKSQTLFRFPIFFLYSSSVTHSFPYVLPCFDLLKAYPLKM